MKLGFDPVDFMQQQRARHPERFVAGDQVPEPATLRGCKEAARLLGVKVRWLQDHLNLFPHTKVNGRVVLFDRDAILSVQLPTGNC